VPSRPEGFANRSAAVKDFRMHYVIGGVIPDCGHWVAAENPDFVRTSLQRFLRDQE
jgi:pimeloyl-ACP methyl ester carboxylesterase